MSVRLLRIGHRFEMRQPAMRVASLSRTLVNMRRPDPIGML
jgi:hypothetical protein